MADINLLQNRLKDTTYVATKRTKLALILALVVLILIVLGAAALYLLTKNINSQTLEITQSNTQLQEKLDSHNDELDKAKVYQAQLINLDSLLKRHVAMTPLLEELGKYSYIKAQFTSVDIAQDTGKIHLEGSVDSYQGLGKLLLGLSTSQNFQDVKLLSVIASSEGKGYAFSIDMTAKKDIFIKQK